MGPCELCISKTFPTCLLHVTLSLFGDFGGEKMPPILTCSLLKMKGGGGLPSPWQRSSTVSPSLTKPWGDSFHSSTIVGGSRHTHRITLSRLIQLKSLYISITLTEQTVFGSVSHSIAAEPLQTLTSRQIMWLLKVMRHYWL